MTRKQLEQAIRLISMYDDSGVEIVKINETFGVKLTDSTNCDPKNWELISRAENLSRNGLSDSAIASKLARINAGKQGNFIDREAQAIYMEYPELLDLKRAQLLHRRAIKEAN